MSKLFNLKEWLRLDEAAQYLSLVFNESVSEADVLRLCLDRHLTLSVNFINHATVRPVEVIPIEESILSIVPSNLENRDELPIKKVKYGEIDSLPEQMKSGVENGSITLVPLGDYLGDDKFLQYTDKIISISGVWDLPMIGGERLDIEQKYQMLTGGPEITLSTLSGAFAGSVDDKLVNIVESFDENEYQEGSEAQLREIKHHISVKQLDEEEANKLLTKHKEDRVKYLKNRDSRPKVDDHYPRDSLPEDSFLVVRTGALRKFVESTNDRDEEVERPVSANERNSLLTIIASLCKYAGVEIDSRGVASKLTKMTEEIGAPVSDDTVRRILKKIPDALESRMK